VTSENDRVSRADFERAIRSLNATHLHNRDAILQLAAHVMALTDELSRRLATEDAPSVASAIDAQLRETLEAIRTADLGGTRVALDLGDDKPPADIPCAELIPLCGGRCCTYTFALSTKELDEGVIRWDYGRPYIIRQRASDGFCVHNDPVTRGCEVHTRRPAVCRGYDCRSDRRVWIDYEKRIPQPLDAPLTYDEPQAPIDLRARMRQREEAVRLERVALDTTLGDGGVAKPRP
jgi:hypothetical protein